MPGLILLFCCVGQLRPIRSQYDGTLANERADLGDEEGPEEGNSPLVRSDHIRSWVFVYVQVRRFETKQQSKMRNYLVLSIILVSKNLINKLLQYFTLSVFWSGRKSRQVSDGGGSQP